MGSRRSARTRPWQVPLLALVGLGAGCAAAGFSPQPPELGGAPKLWVPEFTSTRLGNGLSLHVNPDPYLPMVAVAVGIRGGALLDPPEKAGLTALLAEAMVARTERLDRQTMAAVYDAVGGQVRARVGPDGIVLSIEVLEDGLAGALKLLAEILLRPGFDPGTLAWLKADQVSWLASLESDPTAAAMQGLRQVVFGTRHPLGLPLRGTRSSVRSFTLEDLQARHRLSVQPANVAIAVAGRAAPAEVQQLVSGLFGGWASSGPALGKRAIPAAPAVEDRHHVHMIARPGLSQTVVYVGRLGLGQSDARYYFLRIAARRVAASAGGWLRGVEHMTYGVGAIDDASARFGIYGAHLAVDAKATGEGVRSMVERYDAMPGGFYDIEKVVVLTQEGRPYYTIAGRTGTIAELFLLERPVDHFKKLREMIDDDRGNDLTDVTYEFIKSSKMQVVLVGDPDVIRAQVSSLGLGELRPLQLALD
jgi:predicted Zn-dependent peptidase